MLPSLSRLAEMVEADVPVVVRVPLLVRVPADSVRRLPVSRVRVAPEALVRLPPTVNEELTRLSVGFDPLEPSMSLCAVPLPLRETVYEPGAMMQACLVALGTPFVHMRALAQVPLTPAAQDVSHPTDGSNGCRYTARWALSPPSSIGFAWPAPSADATPFEPEPPGQLMSVLSVPLGARLR